ncbi:TonB-dependent receptor [Maricaulis sp.]|uniref:TonB-dependent receptor n=1 Tax=Maricaulis sp. TaxID=1486257 RepID=UPI003A8E4E23
MIRIKKVLLSSTAYAMALATGVVAVPMLAPVASAQDYTTGAISGTVTTPSGEPVAGASVTMVSQSQGFTRELTTGANGVFRATLLPQGDYTVMITAPGYSDMSDTVRITVGGQSNYSFQAMPAGSSDVITVTGTAVQQLQFQQTTSGLNMDVSEMLATMPIGRNIESLVQLTPTVVQGDGAFETVGGGGASPAIGGGSAAENAFYINGLNITNFDTYLGAATVPFDFYQTVEVKNGGYPAEFGRATGGVVNAVTKSGTNEFMFAVHGNWAPGDLASNSPDTYLERNELADGNSWDVTVEAGGALIPDRLFAYGLYQFRDTQSDTASIADGAVHLDESDSPFFGFKLDGYVTDDHHLEFTYFDTTRETTRSDLAFDGVDMVGGPIGGEVYENGGASYVAKYTGNITDFFTLSAAYGVSEDRNSTVALDPDTPYIVDQRSGTAVRVGPQTSASNDLNETRREFYRIDGDFFFNVMGEHHLRVGYDNEQLSLAHVSARTGGADWRAYTVSTSTEAIYGLPAGSEIIRSTIARFGGSVEGENESFYIQDSWDVSDRLNLQIGLRNDRFVLHNLVGETPVDLDNNWGPRFGFNYDIFGDGTTRLFGSFGRYYIPPALNMSYRGADYYVREYHELLSLDTTAGTFVLGDTRTDANSGITALGASACPGGAISPAGDVACIVYGAGIQEPAISKTSLGLEATNEDEFSIGIEHQVDDLWTLGLRATWRVLDNVSEDVSIDAALVAYCDENGIAGCSDTWYGDHQYVIMNPGEGIDVWTRGALPGDSDISLIHLTAEQLNIPVAEREYAALELSFSREFDGVWGLRGSYVWSTSIGNYEGTVLSDNGQTDAGTTILYDHAGLTDNTYGFLPNHRRHALKLWGSYQLTEDVLLGANFAVTSPRQFGCRGVHPTDSAAAAYGASSWYCQGVASRRGSEFEAEWETRLDMSARYTVPNAQFGNLVLRADVFNLLNSSAAVDFNENGDTGAGTPNPNYQSPTRYQAPRSVRIGFDWAF